MESVKDKNHPDLDVNNIKNYISFRRDCDIWCNGHNGYVTMTPKDIWNWHQCPICVQQYKNGITERFKIEFYKKFDNDEYNIDDCNITMYSDEVVVHTKTFGDLKDTASNILHRSKYPLREYYDRDIKLRKEEESRIKLEKQKLAEQKKQEIFDSKLNDIIKIHGLSHNIQYIKTNNKYDFVYSYECEEHGVREYTYKTLMSYSGCPACINAQKSKNKSDNTLSERAKHYFERCTEKHMGRYKYDNAIYTNKKAKVYNIECPIHGYFDMWATNHLYGHGCPKCNMSKLEEWADTKLNLKGIKHYYYWFLEKDNPNSQSLDFYLPDYNIGIECQGSQHYEAMTRENGQKEFERQTRLDKRKVELCKKLGITLIYFADKKYAEQNEGHIWDLDELIEKIQENNNPTIKDEVLLLIEHNKQRYNTKVKDSTPVYTANVGKPEPNRIWNKTYPESKPVVCCSLNDEYIMAYPSIRSTELDGFTPKEVRRACTTKSHFHKGYKWYLKEEYNI